MNFCCTQIRYIILISFLITLNVFSQNSQPYTILISFDGFRWDYPNRGITPTLGYVEKNGVSAVSLQPAFPSKTFPNHYTIVTGLYPKNHGLISNNMYDPVYNETFSLSNRSSVQNSRWYRGEAIWETARKQGVKTASYFWPGSEINLDYRRPDYFEFYDHDRPYGTRIQGIIEWLKLPYNERPRFITAYFDAADTYGHRYGPVSDGINKAIMNLDSLLMKLFEELRQIDLFDSTNIIIVSDHGMNEVSSDRIINIDQTLSDFDYLTLDDGPFMFIYPEKKDKTKIIEKLKESEEHFNAYLREELPQHFHLSGSHLLADIVIIAEPGWSLINNKLLKHYFDKPSKGNHGYDNFHIDMHGIFYAIGPSFKKNYKTGTIRNIDIYPLLCKILNILPKENIDGKLERIQAVLK